MMQHDLDLDMMHCDIGISKRQHDKDRNMTYPMYKRCIHPFGQHAVLMTSNCWYIHSCVSQDGTSTLNTRWKRDDGIDISLYKQSQT